MNNNNIVEKFYEKNKLLIDYISNKIINSYVEKAEISWKFAYEEYKEKGRGCIFIYLKDLEYALTITDIPSIYVTKPTIDNIGYEPGINLVETYDYKEQCVIIICIDVTNELALHRAYRLHKDLKLNQKENTQNCTMTQDINSLGLMLLKESLTNQGCSTCNKKPEKIYKCAKCGVAKYCSKECQIEDWKIHKVNCNLISLCHHK